MMMEKGNLIYMAKGEGGHFELNKEVEDTVAADIYGRCGLIGMTAVPNTLTDEKQYDSVGAYTNQGQRNCPKSVDCMPNKNTY